MTDSGLDVDIGKQIGRSPGAVREVLRKTGTIRSSAENQNVHITREFISNLIKLYLKNELMTEICKILHTSQETIRRVLITEGVPKRKKFRGKNVQL